MEALGRRPVGEDADHADLGSEHVHHLQCTGFPGEVVERHGHARVIWPARHLQAEQLTLADRVMALADVFEALTAADRPYKQPKTLTESLRIMAFMAKDQHIDPAVFRYFLNSGIWQTFADQFLQPSQIDAVDVAAIHKLIPAAA
jgi:hypothetical protein